MNAEHFGYDGLLGDDNTMEANDGGGGALHGGDRYMGRVGGRSSGHLSNSGNMSDLGFWGLEEGRAIDLVVNPHLFVKLPQCYGVLGGSENPGVHAGLTPPSDID